MTIFAKSMNQKFGSEMTQYLSIWCYLMLDYLKDKMKAFCSLFLVEVSKVYMSNHSENEGIEFNFAYSSKETEKAEDTYNQSNEESIRFSQKFVLLQLESCWEYLPKSDICKLDSALTEKDLREAYFSQLGNFYTINSINSIHELEWILKRGVRLTVCRLQFDYNNAIEYGKQHTVYLR